MCQFKLVLTSEYKSNNKKQQWRERAYSVAAEKLNKNRWKMILHFWRLHKKIYLMNSIIIARKIRQPRKNGKNYQTIFSKYEMKLEYI